MRFEDLDAVFYAHFERGELYRRSAPGVPVGSPAGSCGHLQFSFSGKKIYVHKVVFCLAHGRWPVDQVDHINGDPTDNRSVNLREATSQQNSQNLRRPHKDNRTGLLGVSPCGSRFRASISVHGRKTHLGNYGTPEEAYQAYLKAKAELHPFATICNSGGQPGCPSAR